MILYAPISKANIDVENRTVTGIAQVETAPDHQGDVVDFEGSKAAFAAWSGNVREMHQKKAVGKCLKWWADPIKKAIHVKLKISKGAEDTWQKILDGTLSALSIGGHEQTTKRDIDKSTGLSFNRIMKYVLTELSVVDSPANPQCVITAITKNRNGNGLHATDVLDTLQGGSKSMALKKAHAALRSVAKTLGDNDEMFVIRKSDIEIVDGRFILKAISKPGIITKDDAGDAGMMSDDDQVNAGDMGGIDLEDHASNAANMHKDLCTASGIDDHLQHYQDATQGDDEAQDGGDGAGDGGNGGGGGMEYSRKTGKLIKRNGKPVRARENGASIDKRVEAAVGNAMTPITKAIDELRTSLGAGSALAPRRETGVGVPIVKDIAAAMGGAPGAAPGEGEAPADGTLEKRYVELEAKHTPMNERYQTLIAKSKHAKLSSDESIEGAQLSKAMGPLEVEMAEIKRQANGL